MAYHALISIFCADRIGLISAITGRMFDLGANLGDTTFAVLGEAAEFTGICELPDEAVPEMVLDELSRLPELAEARIDVRRFDLTPLHGPMGRANHRIECEGPDQPGLLARLSEVFMDYDANIVRMNAERVPGAGGHNYIIRFTAAIPDERAEACLNTLANTAEQLGQALRWQAADRVP